MQKAWSYSCYVVEFRSALLSSLYFKAELSAFVCFLSQIIGVVQSFSASISSQTLYQLFCRQRLSTLSFTPSSLLILEEDIFTLIKCFISLNGSFCMEQIIYPLCSFIFYSLSFLSVKTSQRFKGTNPMHATRSLPLIAIRQIAKVFVCLAEQVSQMFSSTVQEMDFAQNSIQEWTIGSLSFFLMTNWMRHSRKGTLACRCLILIYLRGIKLLQQSQFKRIQMIRSMLSWPEIFYSSQACQRIFFSTECIDLFPCNADCSFHVPTELV